MYQISYKKLYVKFGIVFPSNISSLLSCQQVLKFELSYAAMSCVHAAVALGKKRQFNTKPQSGICGWQ